MAERVNVWTPDGDLISIPSESLADATRRGYRPETRDEERDRAAEEQYGSGASLGTQVRAQAEAGLSGLTLGVSDAALVGLGADPVGMRERRERQPTTLTQLASSVLPTLVTGGAGAAGTALRVAGALPRAAASAGRATEALVARSVGGLATRGLAGRAAAKGLELGAGAAVEAAPAMAGAAVSDIALGNEPIGDPELVAQRLIAGVGMGSILAGGAGALIGAGSVLAPAAVRAAGRGARAAGEAAIPAAAKASSSVSGVPEEYIAPLYQRALRGETLPTAADEARSMADVLQPALDDAQAARKLITREARPAIIERELADAPLTFPDRDGPLSTSMAFERHLREQADDMAANVAEFGGANTRALRSVADNLGADIKSAKTAADHFHALDRAKRAVGDLVPDEAWTGRMDDMASLADRNTARATSGLYDSIKQRLEDTEVFGGAAVMQRRLNAATAKRMRAEAFARKTFMEVAPDGARRISHAKLERFANSIGQTRGEVAEEGLDYLLTAEREYADTVSEIFGAEVGGGLAESVAAAAGRTTRARDELLMLNRLKAMKQGAFFRRTEGIGIGEYAAAQAAQAAGLSGGAIAAGAAIWKGLTNPAQTAGVIGGIVRAAQKVGAVQEQAFRVLFAGARRATPAATRRAVAELRDPDDPKPRRESRADRHLAETAYVARLASDPAALIERVGPSLGRAAEDAPQVAQAASAAVTRGVQFLASKVPPDRRAGRSLNTSIAPRRVSDAEIAKFDRYKRATLEPQTLVDDLLSGRLTTEAVEAAKAVHPALYADMRRMVAENAVALRRELPYQDRLQLSILMEVPIDNATSPAFITSQQAQYNTGEQSQSANESAPAPPASGKTLDLAASARSATERVASR